jgi:anti-sigma-K factor RskA
MTHDDVRGLFAEYLFGTLESGPRADVDGHLATCPQCRTELAEEARVVDAIGRSVAPVAPPPDLRARILRAAGEEAGASVHPFGPAAQPASVRRPALPWLFAAAAALLALVAGWQLLALQDARERVRVESADQERALAVLAAADLIRYDLKSSEAAPPDARARAFWSPRHGMVFAAEGLATPPAGRTYQLWVISGGRPISAGVFTTGSTGQARVVIATPPGLTGVEAVAVTVEPEGGVAAPSSAPILAGAAAE